VLDQLRHRLRPHPALAVEHLAARHFPLWRRPDPSQARHLVAAVGDRQHASCAGGPIGLLDLATTEQRHHAGAARRARDWAAILTGTPPARPWSHFLDAHNVDPDHYPVPRAIARFQTQPRIAALAAAVGGRLGADMYGPGLQALQAGTGCFAAYRAGVSMFADGLLTLDRQLLSPSFTPLLIEQTLDERQAFHDAARDHLTAAHPATVLVAVRCRQYPTAWGVTEVTREHR
jgi:hypothetical protein